MAKGESVAKKSEKTSNEPSKKATSASKTIKKVTKKKEPVRAPTKSKTTAKKKAPKKTKDDEMPALQDTCNEDADVLTQVSMLDEIEYGNDCPMTDSEMKELEDARKKANKDAMDIELEQPLNATALKRLLGMTASNRSYPKEMYQFFNAHQENPHVLFDAKTNIYINGAKEKIEWRVINGYHSKFFRGKLCNEFVVVDVQDANPDFAVKSATAQQALEFFKDKRTQNGVDVDNHRQYPSIDMWSMELAHPFSIESTMVHSTVFVEEMPLKFGNTKSSKIPTPKRCIKVKARLDELLKPMLEDRHEDSMGSLAAHYCVYENRKCQGDDDSSICITLTSPQLFRIEMYDKATQNFLGRCYVYALDPLMAISLFREAGFQSIPELGDNEYQCVVSPEQTTDCTNGFLFCFGATFAVYGQQIIEEGLASVFRLKTCAEKRVDRLKHTIYQSDDVIRREMIFNNVNCN